MYILLPDEGENPDEAAAVGIAEQKVGEPAEPVEFVLNRAFLFTIADDRTGSILFMGKVAEP